MDGPIPKLDIAPVEPLSGIGKVRATTPAVATLHRSIRSSATPSKSVSRRPSPAQRCRAKFLRYFPTGYRDDTYLDWERNYKWTAHLQWKEQLNRTELRRLLSARKFGEIALRAVRIESRTNLLFSFEKMALRDAIKTRQGAETFARGLDQWLHGSATSSQAFEAWVQTVATLPRRQTRVLTWPLVTVFGFLAQPEQHIFLKPNVTRTAARAYAFPFRYVSRPTWDTYASLLEFAETVRRDTRDLEPRDMIDLQSFIWVQGSDEY